MKLIAFLIFATLTFSGAWAATAKKKPVARGTKTATKLPAKSRSKKGAPAPRRVTQQVPSPERYKEIQQALATKGYLKSEPNGVWDAQSAEALKRFQTENQLSPTGKLSSASLIGLGLGGAPQSAATVPPPSPTPSLPN